MKVKEIIEGLSRFPEDTEVYYISSSNEWIEKFYFIITFDNKIGIGLPSENVELEENKNDR